MTGAVGPHAPLAERIRRIAYVATPWFPPSDCAALREAAAVLERVEPQPQGAHHARLCYGPPYVGGDDDEITEWWGECSCGWKGSKRDEYGQSLASKDLVDHLNAALAAQPPVPLQQENQHRADLRQARATASGAPDGEANA